MAREPRYAEIRPRTRRLGHVVLHVAETRSTMSLAREHAEAGAPEGLVVVADRQTAGVGRRGNPWTTVGASLHATLVLRPTGDSSALALFPLAAGVAAVRAARKLLGLELRLKWPNDLLHKGHKVGGLLVDAVWEAPDRPRYVLLGLGVNGDARPEDFPPELRPAATSLSQAAGRHVCLPAFLKLFLEALEPRYDRLASGDPESVWAEAHNLIDTLGQRVRVRTDAGPVEGLAVDLGPEGELLVRDRDRTHAVRAGECEEIRAA